MRFDPYTGEPIKDDEPNTDSTKDITTNQEAVNTPEQSTTVDSEGYGRVEPQPTEPTPQIQPQYNTQDTASTTQGQYTAQSTTTTSQGQYNANNQGQYNSQSYNAYGNPNPQGQPYNPYNGQQYNQPADQDAKANKLGTAALVCGIISIVFSFASCCCPIISLGTGIAAIICGANAKKSNGERDGKGTGGIVTGIIGLVLMVIVTIIFCIPFLSAFSSSSPTDYDSFRDYFEKNYNNGMGTDSNVETTPSVSFDDITVR